MILESSELVHDEMLGIAWLLLKDLYHARHTFKTGKGFLYYSI
jgi:hypothetical protein